MNYKDFKHGQKTKGYIVSVEHAEIMGYRFERDFKKINLWHRVKQIRLEFDEKLIGRYFGSYREELVFEFDIVKDKGTEDERDLWNVYPKNDYRFEIYGDLITLVNPDIFLGKELFEI